jgi:hypothetical protein
MRNNISIRYRLRKERNRMKRKIKKIAARRNRCVCRTKDGWHKGGYKKTGFMRRLDPSSMAVVMIGLMARMLRIRGKAK